MSVQEPVDEILSKTPYALGGIYGLVTGIAATIGVTHALTPENIHAANKISTGYEDILPLLNVPGADIALVSGVMAAVLGGAYAAKMLEETGNQPNKGRREPDISEQFIYNLVGLFAGTPVLAAGVDGAILTNWHKITQFVENIGAPAQVLLNNVLHL